MKPTDKPVEGKKNDPMMPIAWTKTYTGAKGKTARVFTTTMGASQDLQSEGLRRLLVNACYWAVGLEDKIAPRPTWTSSASTVPARSASGRSPRGSGPPSSRPTASEDIHGVVECCRIPFNFERASG